MRFFYADTSALVSAYLSAEADHAELKKILFGGFDIVLTSELTRLEFASAIVAAKRFGRVPDLADLLNQFDQDSRSDDQFSLIPLVLSAVMPAARALVTEHYLVRTLDAIHIAVALRDAVELADGQPVTFVTRDKKQAEAAKANGLEVW